MDAATRARLADPPPDRLADLVARAAKAPVRVRRLVVDGTPVWLKRPERRESLRWRLQKGDPRRAFAADLAGLRFLAEKGIPAPKLLLVGADLFVTEDAGRPLDQVLRDGSPEDEERPAIAAATTLASLHRAGARHGRPKLRDICWDGATARLIDLERFSPQASARAMGLDWAILLHSLLETQPQARKAFAAVVRTYRELAPPAAVAAGARLIRRLDLAQPLLKAALWLRPNHRELTAAARLPGAFRAV